MRISRRKSLPFFLSIMFLFAASATSRGGTFAVNSDGSESDLVTNNGVCLTSAGTCTLHAAIEEANHAPGSIILFSGQYTIRACSLPTITANSTVINAYNQWNTTLNRPGVILESTYNCGALQSILTIGSSNNHVYGIFFLGDNNSGTLDGIRINSGNNSTIGAETTNHQNYFVVSRYGIRNSTNENTISYNYFGTSTGTSTPNPSVGQYGIYSIGSNSTITNNLAVGQSGSGIYLQGSNNDISNNIIGLNKSESSTLPNTYGLIIEFGSLNDIYDNTIGGNSSSGIWLATNADNNQIYDNEITTPYSLGSTGNGSHGVYILNNDNNTIRDNHIVNNAGSGIYASSADGLTITGNNINNNDQHGLHLDNVSNSTVGGNDVFSKGNKIHSNDNHGLYLENSSSVTVSANLIGQDSGGTDKGNMKCGIFLDSGSAANTIGGETAAEGNWIGWNNEDGIRLSGSTTSNNSIRNNILGAPLGYNWQAGNKGSGISMISGTHDNTIGGSGAGNTILASSSSGIILGFCQDNSIIDNKIGTDGSHHWGNSINGISILLCDGTQIESNEIAYNGTTSLHSGIVISGNTAINNTMTRNTIYQNSGSGIQLADGANGALASPVISLTGHTITGSTCNSCEVEIYSDSKDQGRFFEGSVTADPSGNFSWLGNFRGRNITTTATAPSGDTSMFSTPIPGPFSWVLFNHLFSSD